MINLYYHSGSGNHGCEAIIRSTCKLLRKDLVLWSTDPEEDKAYGLSQIVNIQTDRKASLTRPEAFLYKMHHKLTGDDYFYTKYSQKQLFSSVRAGDVWLSIGGDNYCYIGVDKLGHYNKIIHEKGGRTVLWGCSIEPSVLSSGVVEDLKSYDLITVRESLSYESLLSAGIERNVVLCSDPAFQLDYIKKPLFKDGATSGIIGINVSPLVLEYGDTVFDNYRELIRYILNYTDFNIVLVPHVVKSKSDDRIPLNQLFQEFNSSKIIKMEDQNCMELKNIISQCRMFVGARTHATIAAYSSCVPTLVTGYSIKARGIAKDIFGTDENYVIPAQSLTSPGMLVDAFIWLLDHETEIRTHLEEIMPSYSNKANRAVTALEKLMI